MKPGKIILLSILATIVLTSRITGQPSWRELKSDVINAYSTTSINALAKNSTGNILYAAIGRNVLRWSGIEWTKLGTAENTFNSEITTLATDGAGNVYAAGYFGNANLKAYVAKWNGSNWSELGTGSNSLNALGVIYSIATDAAGNVYAAGSFNNGVGKKYVARWDGTTWSELGGTGALGANDFIWSVTTDVTGNVYAGGNFKNSNANRYVAKWDGSVWSELGGTNALAADANILTVATDVAGNVYAGGQFRNASSKCYVARYNGTSWSELGIGAASLNANNWINTILTDGSNIYAAGSFSVSGRQYVAKWNGSSWSAVGGSALNALATIRAIAKLSNGDLYAAGDFLNPGAYKYVAKWNSSTNLWSESGSGGVGTLNIPGGHAISAVTTDRAGNVYVAGSFGNDAGYRTVKKWNGKVWAEVASSTSSLNANWTISDLAIDAWGNLYAAGSFTDGPNSSIGYEYVAKWDGTTWTQLGTGANALKTNGTIYTIAIDSMGNVYAAGEFTNSAGKYYVGKWNGTTWTELGAGASGLDAYISVINIDKFGNVYAGGGFSTNGVLQYTNVVKWTGTSWASLGGYNGTYELTAFQVAAMEFDSQGNLYAGGPGIGDIDYNAALAKWDGAHWSIVANGANELFDDYSIGRILVDNQGNVYAGAFNTGYGINIAKWDGIAWTLVGGNDRALNASSYIGDMAFDMSGNIYAGGSFVNALGKIYVAVFSYSPTRLCTGETITISSGLTSTTYQWQVSSDSVTFSNISDNVYYNGTNTMTLQLSNIPSSWTGYHYRCKTNPAISDIFTIRFFNTWTGAINNQWDNPGNWSCGVVPDNFTDVVIKSPATIMVNASITIATLDAGIGVNITVAPGSTLTVTGH